MFFITVCLGEIKKQKLNYFNTWSTYISLLIWPILTVVSTFCSYKNFNISLLRKININSASDLAIFLLTGFLCYNCFWVMVQSAFFMQRERENGTLETIFITPAPRLAIVYGRAMGALFQSTWIFILYTVIVLIFGRERFIQVLIIFPVLYVIVIGSAVIWGGFINAIFVMSRDVDFWFTLCDEPMKLLSGVSLPVGIMPFLLKMVSGIFPLTYCLNMIRNLLFNEAFDLVVLLKYIIVNMLIIILTEILLEKAEKNNRKTGNIQLY